MAATAHADPAPTAQEIHRIVAAALDPDFYRAIYPDIPPEMDAAGHYCTQGWREGRDPAPWFSAAAYLADHPDVAQADLEPLHHFLTIGRREGREVRRSWYAVAYLEGRDWAPAPWGHDALITAKAAPEPPATPAFSAEMAREAVAAEFDPAFYLATNPDVAASGMDPLDHFLATGWREARDPSAAFSVHDYLEGYPDVAQSGLNPFAHYLLAGRAEGRRPKHDLGFRYDVIARLKPMAARVAEAA
ncbi:MAG TPA: hypothetical protein VFH92_13320, partial [Phenylobacterium sp.]|nr:hypothetical protein [Phenylobacterium sp.]